MDTMKARLLSRSWTKGRYYISTNSKLVPITELSEAFASDAFYWAKSLPPQVMREMLDNSLVFGLFEVNDKIDDSPRDPARGSSEDGEDVGSKERKFIGLARCVTDFITFVYLTDVWVDTKYQGEGLGTWLIECVQEVIVEMPFLRRSLLFTANWERSVPFYKKLM